MTITVEVERFGRPATSALAKLISTHQGGDPLNPVTVVVPSGTVGLATRRLLASGRLGHTNGSGLGIANVTFTTMAALAERLGGPLLAAEGRRPATDAIVHAVARRVLIDTSGPLFDRVADHPATLSALVATYRDLRHVTAGALSPVAALSERAAEVVRMVTAMKERLADWFDDADLAAAAVRSIASDPERSLSTIGPTVLFLPLTLAAGHELLVRALSDHVPVTVLVGQTGDAQGDEPGQELGRQFGWSGGWPSGGEVPYAHSVVSAPSADAEVLVAVRDLLAHQATGTPLERMAIVHGGQAPYPRLIREVLTQSHIPLNGRNVRTLASTAAGRVLLGLFTIVDHDWRRDDVMAWLASAPIRHRGQSTPTTAWDEVSISAGVTSGLAGWRTHLGALAQSGRASLLLQPDRDDQQRDQLERTVRLASSLSEFVEQLAEAMGSTPDTWREWSAWSRRLLANLVGGPNQAAEWPAQEAAAFTAVDELLAGLAVLDQVDTAPTFAAFRSVVASELDVPTPQTSRFGHGIMTGHVDELIGLDFDVVVVVGMTDGAFPGRVSDDALLPDRERSAHATIPLRATKVAERRRNYLAALLSSPDCVVSFARGDQRAGREQRPSRWLLDSLGQILGEERRLYASDLDGVGTVPGFTVVPSFVSALSSDTEPLSLDDRDTHSMLRWVQEDRRLSDHFLVDHDPVLRLGTEAQHARRSRHLTRFDGLIDGATIPSPAGGSVQSPTGLERYAACPRRYLFERLLRISQVERPEEITSISAMDKGTLVHVILERFMAEQTVKDRAERIAPSVPWSDADRSRLMELATEEFGVFQQRGLTGRPLFWESAQTGVVSDLERFLVEDSAYRARTGSVPEAVELRFGHDGADPVAVPLADGARVVRFRGSADRIDRIDQSGSDASQANSSPSFRVIDYKTGSTYGTEELAEDPVARGTKLQLPIYAEAAAQQCGGEVVASSYWFVSEKAKFQMVDYLPSQGGRGRVSDVLGVLVDGIEGGRFPGRPDQSDTRTTGSCGHCPYNEICPTDRQREWEHKSGDPAVSAYVRLSDGDGDVERGG